MKCAHIRDSSVSRFYQKYSSVVPADIPHLWHLMSPLSPHPSHPPPAKHPANRLSSRLFSSPSTYTTEGDESFIASHNALGLFPRERGRQT